MKVCILTTVHSPFDIRIFHKEAKCLVKAGYDIILIAQYDKEEVVDGIRIVPLSKPKNRLERMTRTVRRAHRKAVDTNADIYHLHDPELIPAGLKLKRLGKKVIFDSHEDVTRQFVGKPYLNRPFRWVIAQIYGLYETWACKRFDAIVGATPFIREKFLPINPLTVDINNFPILGELEKTIEWRNKGAEVCYVGGIAAIRGIRELVKAMSLVKSEARLQLCGALPGSDVEADVRKSEGWSRVDALGFLDRSAVRDALARSVAGLVTFLPLPNHIHAQPNKIFEYMSAGIPVIGSHFPLWREIIEGNDCGLCVDPLSPKAIAEAIDFLVTHPDRAREMGANGLLAIQNRYNWSREEQKLLRLYEMLSQGNPISDGSAKALSEQWN